MYAVLGCMLPQVREAHQKTLFTNIRDVSEIEMAIINFGIQKKVVIGLYQDTEDGDFYEKRSDMKFFVHRMNDENAALHALVSFEFQYNI